MLTLTYLYLSTLVVVALMIGTIVGVSLMALLVMNRRDAAEEDAARLNFMERHGMALHVRIVNGRPHWHLMDSAGTVFSHPADSVRDAITIHPLVP